MKLSTIDWQELNATERREQRRPAAPTEPTAEELAGRDAERMANRKGIKEKVALSQIAEREWSALNSAIAAQEDKKERLAAAHVDACKPWQDELADIQRQQIAESIAREEGDPQLESRRVALRAQVAEKNAELKTAIEAADALIAVMKDDRRKAGERTVGSLGEADLIATARPDLLVSMKVSKSALDWSLARLTKAKERSAMRGERITVDRAYAAAELESAQSAMRQAESDYNAAVKACLEE